MGGWFHGEIIGRIDWPFNDQNFQSAVLKLVRYIILSVSIHRRDIHHQIFDIKMGNVFSVLFRPIDRFSFFLFPLPRGSHSPHFVSCVFKTALFVLFLSLFLFNIKICFVRRRSFFVFRFNEDALFCLSRIFYI